MNDATQVRHSGNILPFPDSPPAANQRAEKMIESRLRTLGNIINDLLDAPYTEMSDCRENIRAALEELAVKEATLRWIVRVAKRTQGAMRERMWSDIERAVADLEKLADSVQRSESTRRLAL
jgi:hypothetical protein